jgi:serine/threonine protein phosphatase PrpC
MFDFCVSVDPRNTGGIGGDNMTCVLIRLNLDPNSTAAAAAAAASSSAK